MKEGRQLGCQKAIPDELLSMLPIDWQRVTHPRLIFLRSQCFIPLLPPCRGAMNNKELVPCSRRGLLAYVFNGVSLTTSALVAGNGSYIVQPCGHDLHGPTVSTHVKKMQVPSYMSKIPLVTHFLKSLRLESTATDYKGKASCF